MTSVLEYLIGSASFMPHGYCLLWRPDLVALHAASDGIIALSYFSIPIAIYLFVKRRTDLEFEWAANLFVLFIACCGLTHLIGLVTLWHPVYGLQGMVKGLTALASVMTAIALWPLMPKLLALPSPAHLKSANRELELEIGRHQQTEKELITARDLLEDKVLERTAELDLERQRLRDALDAISDGFILWGNDGRLVHVNNRFTEIRPDLGPFLKEGVNWREFARRSVPIRLPNATPEELEDFINNHWRQETAGEFQIPDGRWIRRTANLTSEGGSVAVISDITDRVRADKLLEDRAEKLARSNEDLEQFAHIASHDLQAPLRAVASHCTLLSERYGDKLDDEARQSIGFAVEGARRMQSQIRDILAYSRVGRSGSAPVAVDLNVLLARVLEGLSATISEKGASVEAGLLPTVLGIPVQLDQLLQNLIDNGLKYQRDLSPEIRISAQQEGGFWRISVSDNGIGFDMKFADRIFQMFQRLHQRGEYPGTGIGLAMCRKIVEGHGGEIAVESIEGVGSTFHTLLPVAPG